MKNRVSSAKSRRSGERHQNPLRVALRLLENTGVLAPSVPGRSRVIETEKTRSSPLRVVRVAILLYEPFFEDNAEMQGMLFQLQAAIEAAGHQCFFATSSQKSMGFNIRRITHFVETTHADAWLVLAGSRDLLTWFAAQAFSTLAIGGRVIDLPIAAASTDFKPAVSEAVRLLTTLGHRRIVMLCPKLWRSPNPGSIVRAFNAELKEHGITPSDYHVPDWKETPEGLQNLLKRLFEVTPPTAILVEEPRVAVAIEVFAGQRGIRIGSDLSLVCMIDDPTIAWQQPPLAHFTWDRPPLIRRVARWVSAVASGHPDKNTTAFPVRFVSGGTVGRPKDAR